MVQQKSEDSTNIFVLDPTVLLHNPEVINSFGRHEVVIPIVAIDVLDSLKKGMGEIPESARETLRIIGELRKKGNIAKGIRLLGGGIVRTELVANINKNLREKKTEDYIISIALKLRDINKGRREVILVSKNPSAQIKAAALGLKAEDYTKDKTTLFQQHGNVLMGEGRKSGILSNCYAWNDPYLTRFYGQNCEQRVNGEKGILNIVPQNVGQRAAINALTEPEVQVVALTGNAGSGKTLLALAAALHQTIKTDPLFKQVVVARPVVPMGGAENKVGFLPGNIEEKLGPWMLPIFDNLEVILNSKELKSGNQKSVKCLKAKELIENEKLCIQALALIRGRSLPERYIIIDEAQNLRPLDVKTIITRCGEGTKIVFTGDLNQIDTPYLDQESNGLAYLISHFINEENFCYLNLSESVRSKLAGQAARLL